MEPARKRRRVIVVGQDAEEEGEVKQEKDPGVIDFEGGRVEKKSKRELAEEKEVKEAEDVQRAKAEREKERNGDIFLNTDPTAGQLTVLTGKSERGKTHFLKWLLLERITAEHSPFRFGLAFVRTKYRHVYNFLPDDKVFQSYDEEILRKYISNLESIFEEKKAVEPNFVIFDDLIGILNNRTPWFENWIGTFRQLNTHIYIAVQYLTGKNAISPIMREQTNFAIIFNTKNTRSLINLYENYGQLFEKQKEFKQYLFDNTDRSKVGPYVCIVYIEREDDLENNYLPMRAPKELPDDIKLVY